MESATGRIGEVEPSLFARKATGLVRGWAVRDAFIYAFFSINLVTLGFFIFSYAVFIPDGGRAERDRRPSGVFQAHVLGQLRCLVQSRPVRRAVEAEDRALGRRAHL